MKVAQQIISRDKLYIGIIVMLAAIAGYLFLQAPAAEAVPSVTSSVKDVYSLLTEREAEIMAVKEESGLYKVTVKYPDTRGQNVVQDVYLTKDGALMANPLSPNALVRVNETTRGLTVAKQFAECLSDKKLIVFGKDNDLLSLQQLLGYYAYKIYVDCSQNTQLCQQVGVTQTPLTMYGNTTYRGLPLAREAAELTGCQPQG
ncbi:MAG: hypothetical protein HYY37_03855 [Candidatus Aenigmarchaeota archaeon]|nr:hypothetical protein [Candidatus Aenigmarchaeota archaeon]